MALNGKLPNGLRFLQYYNVFQSILKQFNVKTCAFN